MSNYEATRKELSNILGDDESPVLKRLDACFDERNRDLAISAEQTPIVEQLSDMAVATEVQPQDLESQIDECECCDHNDWDAIDFAFVDSSILFPGMVDDLLDLRSIADAVARSGSRLLVQRSLDSAATDHANHLPSVDDNVRFDVCDTADEFFQSLHSDDAHIIIFGCGRGYVTDHCLITNAYVARHVMLMTIAAANQLRATVDYLAEEGQVRTTKDGIRSWSSKN